MCVAFAFAVIQASLTIEYHYYKLSLCQTFVEGINDLYLGTAGRQNEAASTKGNRPTSRSTSSGVAGAASSAEPSEVQIVTTVRARAGATLTRPVIVYNCPPASLASRLYARRSDPTSAHHHLRLSSGSERSGQPGRVSNI